MSAESTRMIDARMLSVTVAARVVASGLSDNLSLDAEWYLLKTLTGVATRRSQPQV